MDETYRNQLRELNELNWERFRSELRAELETRLFKRMFMFWTATTIPLAILIISLSGALQR